jgi:hypothetical protein
MRRLLVFLPFCVCSAAVLAQPGQRPGQGDPQQLVRDQRRNELREVLRPPRQAGFGMETTTAHAEPVVPPSHHLTPEGRAELREQLRREHNDNRRQRP